MMMKARLLACAAIALVAAAVPALAQDKVDIYKPNGPWSVDYGEDYCRLSRNFTSGPTGLSVAFERIRPGADMRLILVGSELKTYHGANQLGWHFTPNDAERKSVPMRSKTADGKVWYNLGEVTIAPLVPTARGTPPPPPSPYSRDAEQAAAKAVTGFIVDGSVTQAVQVDTGDLSVPVAALQACADDLAKGWGLDPAKLQAEKSPAIPENGGVGWLPQGTIAFGDFAKLGGGSNEVRLMVDANGKPTSCTIHWATLDQTTNDKICKTLMADARFTPAHDADGQPMAGYWVGNPMFLGPPMKGFGH
jgi:hypothetical protein